MKLKRLVTSVSTSIDEFISSVENHEAVADAAIKDARKQTAKVKCQLEQTRAKIKRCLEREQQFIEKRELWRQRALTYGKDDRATGLACMESVQASEQELAKEQNLRASLEQTAAELQQHLSEMEARLREMEGHRQNLAARTAKNKTLNSLPAFDRSEADISDVFQRWETVVIAEEYQHEGAVNTPNSLDRELSNKERKQELSSALDELLAGGADE